MKESNLCTDNGTEKDGKLEAAFLIFNHLLTVFGMSRASPKAR